jgi:polynucleotide 5'-kinase involved in rRNA processing
LTPEQEQKEKEKEERKRIREEKKKERERKKRLKQIIPNDEVEKIKHILIFKGQSAIWHNSYFIIKFMLNYSTIFNMEQTKSINV